MGWRKVRVEGFGPIRRAEVELAPLMVLVGENNTGKSWLAQLLWGLGNTSVEPGDTPAWRALKAAIAALPTPADASEGEAILPALRALWPEVIEALRSNLPAELLGDGAALDRLEVDPEEIQVERRFQDFTDTLRHAWGGPNRVSLGSLRAEEAASVAAGNIVGAALNGNTLRTFSGYAQPAVGDGLFFPASRTGFVLLYRDLTAASFRSAFGARPLRTRLTAPMVHFLSSFATASPRPMDGEAFDQAAGMLEAATRGVVELVGEGAPDWRFLPRPGAEPIPLHQASSLVTELLPIIGMLRTARYLPFVVIEEPEVHLHPAAQRAMARAITRLVRGGIRVIVTTHGDYLVQHLNNLLKLGAHPDREAKQRELGYEADDFLLDDEVRGYQFVIRDGGTDVEPVARTPDGLVMPTFNDELRRIQREIHLLSGRADG